MADEIKRDEIVPKKAIDEVIKDFEMLRDTIKESHDELAELLKISANLAKQTPIKSFKDFEKLKTQVDAVNGATEELSKLDKERIKLEQKLQELNSTKIDQNEELKVLISEQRKINKEFAKDQLGLISAYEKESKRLRALKNELKAVIIEKGKTSKEAKKLAKEVQKLDAELKDVDATAGDFHRNVGNYSSALKGFGKSILGVVGAIFSVDAVKGFVRNLFNVRAEFQKLEAVLTNTLGSNSQAQKALKQIQNFASQTPFSVRELTDSFVKLANQGFRPTTRELRQLGDLAASTGKSFDQLAEAIIDAQVGEFERLKEFGIRARKEGDNVTFTFKGVQTQVENTEDSIREYITSLGDLEGVSGSTAAISETLGGKVSNLKDSWDNLLNTLGKDSEGPFNFVIGLANDLLTRITEIIGGADALIDKLDQISGITEKQTKVQTNALKVTRDNIAANKDYATEIQKLLEFQGEQVKRGQEQIKTLRAVADETIKNDPTKFEDFAGRILLAEKKVKSDQELFKSLVLVRKGQKDFNDVLKEYNLLQEKATKVTDKTTESLEKQKEQVDLIVDEDFVLKSQGVSDEDVDEVVKALDNRDKITGTKLHERLQRDLDAEKAAFEERKKERQKFEDFIINSIEKEGDKRAELIEEGINREIAARERAVDLQLALAQQGAANTLGEEIAALEQAELEKQRLAEREEARLKRRAYFEAFIKKIREADGETGKAAFEALAEIAIAEGVARNFAGAFAEGKEKIPGKGTETSDSNLALISKNESIVTAKGTKENKGLVTAMNNSKEEVDKWFYKNRQPIVQQQVYDDRTGELIEVSKKMLKELKENRGPNISWDKFGNMIKQEVKNGVKKQLKIVKTKARI